MFEFNTPKNKEIFGKSELFKKIFLGLEDAIFILDNKNPPVIIDCNPAAVKIFGYKKEEMIGKTTEFLHVSKETLKEFQKVLYPTIEKEGKLVNFRFRMKRKNGEVFPTEHFVFPLKDESGRRIGWVSIVRDISEREKMEKELRKSEERYRNLFELAVDPIVILDKEARFIEINKKVEELLGYTKEDLIGKKITEAGVLTKKSVLITYKNFLKRMAGFEIKPYEIEVIKKNGEIIIGEINAAPIKEDGKIVGDLVIIRDITERKKYEEELKKLNEELKAKVDELEKFQKVAVGRELKMIELKKKIQELEEKLKKRKRK